MSKKVNKSGNADESIYNMIPPPEVIPEKAIRHRSKFPPNVPPTGSTFGILYASSWLLIYHLILICFQI